MVNLIEKIKDCPGGFHSWWISSVGIVRKPNSSVKTIEPNVAVEINQNKNMTDLKVKVLFKRFLRGFLAGFVGSAISVGVFTGTGMKDLMDWLAILSIVGLAGGIAGAILSVDKYLRWIEKPENNS